MITDANGKSVTMFDENGKIPADSESKYTITVASLSQA